VSAVVRSEVGAKFDAIRRIEPNGIEWWSARDLMPMLGYERWERFEDAIDRARSACQNSGHAAHDHFRGAGKLIQVGKGAVREVPDYHLTRYGSYLAAMNGDPRKKEIADAQTYFAVKTREAETAAASRELTRTEILRMALDSEEKRLALEAKVAEDAPKVEAFEHFMDADGCYLMADAAKILAESIGLGQNKLYAWLRDNGVLQSRSGVKNHPYQRYIDAGWFTVAPGSYEHPLTGERIATQTTRVRPAGIEGIRRLYASRNRPAIAS
jgi:DNA-damage-inducible protein D